MTLTPEDQLLLATMPFNIQDVEDIVNERGPKTISGRPFWEVKPPGPHDYEYGPQYPYSQTSARREIKMREPRPRHTFAGHSCTFSGGSGPGADQL